MHLAVKRLTAAATLPNFAHASDAGMDITSSVAIAIPAGERALVPTGIALAIPEGYVGLIWDKSGIASKAGVTTLAGVIDAGYRGEVLIALLNTGSATYQINCGQKIAQLLVQPVQHPIIEEVDMLLDTERGGYGFGSTGL